jgi:hypothetical protein
MSSFTGKINLLKFKNSCLVTVKGKTTSKRGVFIPLDDNHVFVSADEDLKPKGAYIDINVWENRLPSKFGETHAIRQAIAKEVREKMTDEELMAIPYIGGIKPFEIVDASQTAIAPTMQVDEGTDDLPF